MFFHSVFKIIFIKSFIYMNPGKYTVEYCE